MKYKLFKIINQTGRKPISIWVLEDENRKFGEVIIGKNIKANNILTRYFTDDVAVCQDLKCLKKALNRFAIARNLREGTDVRKRLEDYLR